jgi:predicted secreted protein
MTSQDRRKALRFQAAIVVLVATVLLVATAMSRRFFEQRKPEMPAGLSPVAPVMPEPNSAMFRVTALQGVVEAFQNGQWYIVRPGHLLSTRDVVRTAVGARAMLRRGSVELELRDNMDLRLDDLEKETAKVGLLRGGKVSASVADGNEHVEITARHTKTANVGAARFVVSVSPSGKVNVATSEGSARFAAKGKEVIVSGGNVSTAMPDEAPSDPEPIPQELLLSVIWPDDDRLDGHARLKGRAQPSSQIKVNGTETEVGADGTFRAVVPLKVGRNRVQVDAEDVLGRSKTLDKEVTRAGPAPRLEPTEQELWNP